MSEIIKISSEVIGTEKTNSVNARELHQVLEIGKQFGNWINAQINSLGLEKNVDYIVYEEKVKAGNGFTTKKEYIITTDTAKHISMASRTAKGKEVRNYFIQIEKEYFSPNIQQLSGRVGGLTKANNELRKELDKLRRKSKKRFENLEDDVHELKKRPILISHKNLDEKLEILFRKSDILAHEKSSCFWQESLQNHLRFYKEYVEILQQDGNIPQKWAINQVETEKKKRIELQKELTTLKWRFDVLVEKMSNLQNFAKKIVDFDIENEKKYLNEELY